MNNYFLFGNFIILFSLSGFCLYKIAIFPILPTISDSVSLLIFSISSFFSSLQSTRPFNSLIGISARAMLLWPPAFPREPKAFFAALPASFLTPSFRKMMTSFFLYIPEIMLHLTELTFIKKSAISTHTSGLLTGPRET